MSEHTRKRALCAATREQGGQTAFCPKTLRAAGLLPVAGVGSFLTARCGDARNSPPWPRPKSLAAGPLLILKQALCQPDAASPGRREPRALTAKYAKYAKAAVAATAGGVRRRGGARLPPEGGVPAAVAAVPGGLGNAEGRMKNGEAAVAPIPQGREAVNR